MTVADLKKILNKYPEEMMVMVDGYEAGVGDPNPVCLGIKLNVNDAWYYGPHEIERDNPDIEVLLLART
jgi:hypothetical protein